MPLIDLRLPSGAFGDSTRQDLVAEIVDKVLRHRGVPVTDANRAGVWTYVTEYDPSESYSGGRPDRTSRVAVRISVVAGGLSEPAKQALAAEVTSAIRACGSHDGAENIPRPTWVIFEEVADGNWAADGAIVTLADANAALGVGASA